LLTAGRQNFPVSSANAEAKGKSDMALWSMPSARRLLVVITLSVLAACASVPAPVQEVADAERAVQAAADADAETLAPAAFEKARRKLEAARVALHAQQHVQARQLAEQAVVDAELAQVAAEGEAAARAAAEIRAQIRDQGGPALQPVAGS
jgi:type IV pilus biogenesis protein CpaD/CtpE